MKYLLGILILILSVNVSLAQNKPNELQTKSSLAIRYFNARDYEKAMPLLKDVYNTTHSSTYFRYYLTCLTELHRYTEAEAEIQREIKNQKPIQAEYYVHWGYILKESGEKESAEEKYNLALGNIQANKGSYLAVANTFLMYQEYGWSRDAYLLGRRMLDGEDFTYELARAYLYLRDYENMMEEYLNLLRLDDKQLPRIQSSLSSAMRLDIDDGLRDQFREQILLRIQNEPDIIGYNRLLIWFFLQEKKFASALRQSISIDRRTGNEAAQIAQLGDMALRNKEFTEAKKAFLYLMDQGTETIFYSQAFALNLQAAYLEYIHLFPGDLNKAQVLSKDFEDGLNLLQYSPATINLIQEYAHLLTFYLSNAEKALQVLESALQIPGLKAEQIGLLKTESADAYVYADDSWEAMLIYSQVIEENKMNALGDEVKLKKAKLGYYMGNFSWAKAQLDVLKASTSKLTANDAMELSMLIGNNLNLDTTAVPLTMFAKADLRFFQNRNEEAMTVLDSLEEQFPYHALVDDILYRKAKLEIAKQNYELAATYLDTIVRDYSYELLGDDALYELAEVNNYHLNKKELARDLYKQMLTAYPGSVYIEESRTKYRELREVYPDSNESFDKEQPIIDEIIPDEFE